MSILEVQDLRKTFTRGFSRRKTEAVRGISFSVDPGQVFGFLGPNGAGKTTTIKILMGLIFPTAGRVSVLGAPAGDRAAKARLGYLPENPYFYDYLSAPELLDMVGRIHGLDRAARRKQVGELIERVGLAHAGKRPLRSFSKGMLQRCGLAQALVGDPELVVLDEPMSGLDPLGRKEVRDLLLELRDRGKTVFFCTHILADASMLCDRVGIIVQGELRDTGPLGELLSPKVQSVEVVWRAPSTEAESSGASLREREGEHKTTSEGEVFRTTDPDAAQAFVRAVVECGGMVASVHPHRQSLEELFVSEANAHPNPESSPDGAGGRDVA
ncbi:MAG: ABC transporter ATP-binding protein [Nannocystales bacterium]